MAEALAVEPGLRDAFDALSYARRREWVEAVEEAKRPETRARRIAGSSPPPAHRISPCRRSSASPAPATSTR